MSRAAWLLVKDYCLSLPLLWPCCCCVLQLPGLLMSAEVIETLIMSALPCEIGTLSCRTLLNHFELLQSGTLRVILRKTAGKKLSTCHF